MWIIIIIIIIVVVVMMIMVVVMLSDVMMEVCNTRTKIDLQSCNCMD
jgi:hypothetical protein